jgi:hypothetical protein
MTDLEDPPPNVEEPDNTELALWTWGLSGQPSSWALPSWTPLIDVIRMANRGEADVAAVQQVLDATFPDGGYNAANIVLAHPPVGVFTATVDALAGSVRVDLAGDEDLLLPDENVQWDFGDGTLVFDAGGWDHAYAKPGDYPVRLNIYVAGARYGSGEMITVGDPPEPEVDPGYRERPATVFTGDDETEVYDPSAHTVDEVLAYAAEHPDEVADIVSAEEAGKSRSTLLDKL